MLRGLSASERDVWLRLINLGADSRLISRLLVAGATPEELLGASGRTLREKFGLSPRQAASMEKQPGKALLARQAEAMDRHGIELVPIGASGYPKNLFEMRVPPPAIFVRGALHADDKLAIGMVGPRVATHYGVQMAGRLARGFAPMLTVISGGALGIDSVAHEAAIDAGGRTIAVAGCGLDVDYPKGNEPLRRRIVESGGALLSIFPPGSRPLPGNFPVRNYVLAGLSVGVIVVEASARSGALVTARAAVEEGRPVYAVPGDVTRRNSEGSNALLREGATVCTGPDDVLKDLEGMLSDELTRLRERARESAANVPAAAGEEPLPESASRGAEELLLREIGHAPVSHDDLIARHVPGRLTLGELSTALLMLEMQGKIRQLPGRIYNPA